ncbi:MAG: hypothetical protein ACFFB3_10170 [Candidatus Hodarchaeota archaeon]
MRSDKELLRHLTSFARNEHKAKRASQTEVRRIKPSSRITRGPLPSLSIQQTGQVAFVILSTQGSELRVYGFSSNGQLLLGQTYHGTERQRIEKDLYKSSKVIYRLPLPKKHEAALVRSTKKFQSQFERLLRKVGRVVQRKPQKKLAISLLEQTTKSSDLEFNCIFSDDTIQFSPEQSDEELLLYWIVSCCYIPQKLHTLPILADLASFLTLSLVSKSLRRKMLHEWKEKAILRKSLNQEEFSAFISNLIDQKLSVQLILGYFHQISRWIDYPFPGSSSKVILKCIQQKKGQPLNLGDIGDIFLQIFELSTPSGKKDLIQRAILCQYIDSPHIYSLARYLRDVSVSEDIIELSRSLETKTLKLFLSASLEIKRRKTPLLFELREKAVDLLVTQSILANIKLSEDGMYLLEVENRSDLSLENLEVQDKDLGENFALSKSLSAGGEMRVSWPGHLSLPDKNNFQLRFEISDLRKWGMRITVFEFKLGINSQGEPKEPGLSGMK